MTIMKNFDSLQRNKARGSPERERDPLHDLNTQQRMNRKLAWPFPDSKAGTSIAGAHKAGSARHCGRIALRLRAVEENYWTIVLYISVLFLPSSSIRLAGETSRTQNLRFPLLNIQGC